MLFSLLTIKPYRDQKHNLALSERIAPSKDFSMSSKRLMTWKGSVLHQTNGSMPPDVVLLCELRVTPFVAGGNKVGISLKLKEELGQA